MASVAWISVTAWQSLPVVLAAQAHLRFPLPITEDLEIQECVGIPEPSTLHWCRYSSSPPGAEKRVHWLEGDAELRDVLKLISDGHLSPGDRELFRPLVESLVDRDEYLLLADYASYVACQEGVSRAFRNPRRWTRMSILNTARMGRFSSDRAIREYCRDIWHVQAVPIEVPD